MPDKSSLSLDVDTSALKEATQALRDLEAAAYAAASAIDRLQGKGVSVMSPRIVTWGGSGGTTGGASFRGGGGHAGT